MKFNYENKVWGLSEIKASPFYIQGLKLHYIFKELDRIKGKVLDVGCGAGNVARAIKKKYPNLDVWGVDISKKAINFAKQNPEGVVFKVGNSEKLPLVTKFDYIFMLDLLEHVESPQRTLKEVHRLLKKGGLFHIFLPLDKQPGTLYSIIYKYNWQPKNKHTGHVRVYSNDDFEKMAALCGFKLVNKKYSFHWVFSIFDIAYFSLLELTGTKASGSIEGMINTKKNNIFVKLFNLLYRIVVFVGYVESRIFANIVGGGGHFTFVKK